jgi:hypothetical protein
LYAALHTGSSPFFEFSNTDAFTGARVLAAHIQARTQQRRKTMSILV